MRTGALSQIFGLRLLYQPRVRRLGLAVLVSVFLLVRSYQFVTLSGEIQWGYDFSAYWEAGRRILDGGSVYMPFQTEGLYSPQQHLLYPYPPLLAVLVAPLSAIFDGYRSAHWIWAGLGTAILVLVVVSIARRERLARGFDLFLLVGAALAFAPLVGELVIGNVHLLILGILAAAWLALDRGTPRAEIAAGALIGLATLIKVFPGLVIVWFLVTGRIRAAVAAIVAMALLAVATLPVTGLEPWIQYPIVLLNLGPPTELIDVLAPTVWLSAVMPPIVARLIVTVAGLATVVWAARNRPEPVSYGVTVAVSILIAPALYQHYLAIMVLPLLIGLRYAPPIAWVGLAYFAMSGGEIEALGDAAWIINRAMPTIGALFVVFGLVWFGRRRAVQLAGTASP